VFARQKETLKNKGKQGETRLWRDDRVVDDDERVQLNSNNLRDEHWGLFKVQFSQEWNNFKTCTQYQPAES
jgi:hypothetical protein